MNQKLFFSARLAKQKGGFHKAMIFILKKMSKNKNRTATFVCSLSFKHPKKKIITVEGKIRGIISTKILGRNGFGYDPIFKPHFSNLTFGQMSKLKKIKLDHRFIAFKNKIKGKIGTFSFKDKRVFQELDIYKAEKNKFTKF